jgi:ferrochelatase
MSLLLISHGTVDALEDLPQFLKNIRRGHDPSPELLSEVTRRYQAIGGSSPLNAHSQRLAQKLALRLGLGPERVAYAGRLWAPSAKDAVEKFRAAGESTVDVVPLAQFSAPLYADHVRAICEPLGLEVRAPANWGMFPPLLEAFERRLRATLDRVGDAHVLFSAHSLPQSVIDAGDPYEREVRAAAEALANKLALGAWSTVFQSQGMSTGPRGVPMPWLGPTLETAFHEIAERGSHKQIVIAPIGFLADHVEVLYDLDIEAKAVCDKLGLSLHRTPSLNADDDFVDVLAALVRSWSTSTSSPTSTPTTTEALR